MLTNQSDTVPTKIISAQPDSARQYVNPITMVQHLWAHRVLIGQFTKRGVVQRYKGSYLGLGWSFVTPLALLLVYTFVFSVIFRSRWEGSEAGNHVVFALGLFAGLIAFDVFSETITTAPRLIVGSPNYVKKVVFPLEILPVSTLGSALMHSLFSLVILLLGTICTLGHLPWTLIFLPLMYLPLILLCLGLSWFLASLGVFIRDINHLLQVAVRMILFLTPIFYPISIIPANFRLVLFLNPLTFIVNHFRRVILWGQLPDWRGFFVMTVATFVVCMLGYMWFMKSKKTFADVV